MTTVAFMQVINLLACCLWIPLVLRFYDQWKARKNTISLAIAELIVFAMYNCALQLQTPVWYMTVVNALTCASFHASVRIADFDFNDHRRPQ